MQSTSQTASKSEPATRGRHHASTRYWVEQMKAYAAAIGQVCRALGGFQPQEIDIGGGFAIPRDPFNKVTNYTEPLQYAALHGLSKALKLFGAASRYKVMAKIVDTLVTHPNQKLAPTIEAYGAACTGTLREELPKHGIDLRGMMLQLEPGRAMHGNTCIHLTTVRNIKRMTAQLRYNVIVVDTTEFWFTGGPYEHHLHDSVSANKADARPIDKADIIGRSGYGDRLYPFVPIPQVEGPGARAARWSCSPPTTAKRSASTARRRTASSPTRRRCECRSSSSRRACSSRGARRRAPATSTCCRRCSTCWRSSTPPDLDGHSLLPAAAGARAAEAAPVYFEALSASLNQGWAPLHGLIVDELKYIELPIPELYDLGADPDEARNLAAQRPEALERLRALGYVAADAGEPKQHYEERDDPKRLIEVDQRNSRIARLHEARRYGTMSSVWC